MTMATSSPGKPHALTTESELEPLLRKLAPARRQAALAGVSMATVLASPSDELHEVALVGEGQRSLTARRAASCLLVPAPGDTVMVAGAADDALYLIAVIAQADPARATLAVPGGLTVRAGGAIDTHAPAWNLTADSSQCKVAQLDYQGAELRIGVLVSRFVGRACEVVLDRLHLLTRSSFRLTEEVEQVRAGQIDMQASHTLRLHAQNTLVTSKALVKVDAEQIHMG